MIIFIKAKILFFLTGSYKVSFGGFKNFKIIIDKYGDSTESLPISRKNFKII